MAAHRKLLGIVEAAYQPAPDFDTWARNVAVAVTELFPGPIPAFGVVHNASAGRMEVVSVHATADGEALRKILLDMSAQATPDEVRKLWNSRAGVGTVSERFGAGLQDGSQAWLVASESAHATKDSVGLFFERSDGRMVTFNRPLDERRTLGPRQKASLVRVLSHLALSERLLSGEHARAAVLSTSGKVLHAEGAAKESGARAALRAQARRIDRARGRSLSDDDALEVWRGMVAGRWSLVDEFDSDGKRLFVARENIGHLAGSRALTTREQQVLALVLTGRPNKLVAYELGLAPSTVSLSVQTILAKTGAASRAALLELADALRRRAAGAARNQTNYDESTSPRHDR